MTRQGLAVAAATAELAETLPRRTDQERAEADRIVRAAQIHQEGADRVAMEIARL